MPIRWETQNYCWVEADYIGKGSYGKVYKGCDSYRDKELVAVKVYDVRKLNKSTKKYIEDVHRLSQLNCPYIVHYYARERVKNSPDKEAIIMELADGNLHNELRKPENRSGLPKPSFFILMTHCVQALLALGKCQIAHRDLKPENILICRKNGGIIFKLTDFGCSRSITSPSQPLASLVGTGPYMPSSVIKGKATGAPVAEYTKDQFDIWSATCCFFEAATGRVPFLPDQSRNYFEAMNELLMHRELGTVCAHFDSGTKQYVYKKDLPEQHSSYYGLFRDFLREFFQLMFSKQKEYLKLEPFAELCSRLMDFDRAISSA